MTLVTAMTMNYRGSLNGVGHSPEMGDGREHKRDEVRRRCEVCAARSSANISPATPIDGARHPVWVLSSRHIERASIGRWQGIRAGAPPTLLLARNPRAAEQRDTPSTSTRGLVRPRRRRRLRGSVEWRSVFYGTSTKSARNFPTPDTVDRPDQPRGGSDKPLRSGPKVDRPPTDHGANAADHHGGARPKKRVIGGVKAAIGRQMIAKGC
jgi:hypothetical protein